MIRLDLGKKVQKIICLPYKLCYIKFIRVCIIVEKDWKRIECAADHNDVIRRGRWNREMSNAETALFMSHRHKAGLPWQKPRPAGLCALCVLVCMRNIDACELGILWKEAGQS